MASKQILAINVVRSIRPEVFFKIGVLENFANFTGKHLCQSLFSNKVAGLRPITLFKKRDSGTSVFLWVLRNFKEHLFLENTSGTCFCYCHREHCIIDVWMGPKYISENKIKAVHYLTILQTLLKGFIWR